MPRTLVSVPPAFAAWLRSERRRSPDEFSRLGAFVSSDPPGSRLGSGGGTVSLLHQAWKENGRRTPFESWLREAQTLVLHAGGESRRLPSYAAVGKALLPVPVQAAPQNRRYDQTLADLQVPLYHQLLDECGESACVLVASGDVWLEFDSRAIRDVRADIAGCGMQVAPTVAEDFGVFFVRRNVATAKGRSERPIAFFRQKPPAAEIRRWRATHDFFVDTGLWLLSAAAVQLLFRRCGWSETKQRFDTPSGLPLFLDLYTEIGSALGSRKNPPRQLVQLGWSKLTTSVIPLHHSRFYHVGSTRQLLESYESIRCRAGRKRHTFLTATAPSAIVPGKRGAVWVDTGGDVRWELEGLNVVTGSAPGQPCLHLAAERCLDIVPIGPARFAVRPYHVDDRFRGTAAGAGSICGRPAAPWLKARGFAELDGDVFDLPLYPVLRVEGITQSVVDWFFADEPDRRITALVHAARRLSAAALATSIDFNLYFRRRQRQQARQIVGELEAVARGDNVPMAQDFSAVAELALREPALGEWVRKRGPRGFAQSSQPTLQWRGLMTLAAVGSGAAAGRYRAAAYSRLQVGVLEGELTRPSPRRALKEDQIVWARSPVRLDLAGGWTDTPPYCLEFGGAVLNLAVLLNGQPPIQVFLRPLAAPILSFKSIDLGVSQVVRTYEELSAFRDPRSGFSLPKAAIALAGFHPEFSARRYRTLRHQLIAFGSGLEVSLLSAVPKGSGLGTSSILAATLLGALNRACDLRWDTIGLYRRTMAVEQLLTTGGGWQDQAGALFGGLKLIETKPGTSQMPVVRYLPTQLFEAPHANRTFLLYYTGITRLAKGILKEIVRDMFLGRFETLQTLARIRGNAHALAEAIQRSDRSQVDRAIARSWQLNKALDSGTTTPEIETLLRRCRPELQGAKLLGAGGGGYMLLAAKSVAAGRRIREDLESRPLNARSRFVDFEIAENGLEVTVS